MNEAIYYLIMGMAVGWALSQTDPKNAPPSDQVDPKELEDLEDQDMELPFENNIIAEHAANSGSRDADIRGQMEQDPIDGHNPDCQCFRCIHGDDMALWMFHGEDY